MQQNSRPTKSRRSSSMVDHARPSIHQTTHHELTLDDMNMCQPSSYRNVCSPSGTHHRLTTPLPLHWTPRLQSSRQEPTLKHARHWELGTCTRSEKEGPSGIASRPSSGVNMGDMNRVCLVRRQGSSGSWSFVAADSRHQDADWAKTRPMGRTNPPALKEQY